MGAEVSASADYTNEAMPHFDASANLHRVSLDRILGDTSLHTTISSNVILSTDGSTIDDLSGNSTVSLYPSTVRGVDVDSQMIKVSLDQRNTNEKAFALVSDIANATVNGKFDIDIFAAYAKEDFPNLVKRILKHASPGDTGAYTNPRALETIRKHAEEGKSIDFNYEISVKDLSALQGFFDGTPITASGYLAGYFRGSADRLSLSWTGNFDTLYVGLPGSEITVRNAILGANATDISLDRTLERISGAIRIDAPLARFHNTAIEDLHWGVKFGNSKSVFSLSGIYDSLVSLTMHGTTGIQPYAYSIDIDTFFVT